MTEEQTVIEAAPSKILDRKYRLLSELGRGAMGVVYLAEQLDVEGHCQRQVALKTMRPEFSTDPDFARRFLREIRVAMQLRSAHTVTVYDSGKDEGGQLYYSMELIRGQTLKGVLRRQGPLPVERVVRIAAQICEALAEAHNLPEPVVHRDLKPANIFVETRQGQDWAKIGDFGIAKVLGEHTGGLTQAGESPGTPLYMAPEQWLGEAVDARTDLYALGILIYEMFTGKPPFTTEQGIQALTFQHLQKPPPPLPAAIPAEVRMLVERLLAKTPQERPADALQVRRALETALNGETQQRTVILRSENGVASQATPVQPDTQHNGRSTGTPDGHSTSETVPPAGRSSRRTVVIVSGAAIVLLGVALGLSPFLRQTRHEEYSMPTTPKTAETRYSPAATPPPPGVEVGGVVEVSAGEFWMGCNSQVDKECFEDEKPGRSVSVSVYKIDRTEVTVAAYRQCVRAGVCSRDSFTVSPSCNWGEEQRANHPINCVDWYQAKTYCEWVGKRLPTEIEWEKAARGTDKRIYPWGNEWDVNKTNTARTDDDFVYTAPVGSFPTGASPYGVLDMSGNVFEWTADWLSEEQKARSLRGGSWNYEQRDVRASNRYGLNPDDHRGDIGFRCVQE